MLIVITGPSGVGKTTVIKSLLKVDPDLHYSTSITSRKPRPGELGKIDYKFISKEDFLKKIENDEFVEWSEVYGKYYGRLRKDLEELMKLGDVLVGIDVQGAFKIRDIYPDGIYIFISPRSETALEAQLRGRGTDDEATIKRRLDAALEEMKQVDNFRHVVINNKIGQTVKEVQNIICKSKEQ